MDTPEVLDSKLRSMQEFGVAESVARELLTKFDGDVLLAAGYNQAANFETNIEGDREAWNLKRAKAFADDHVLGEGYAISAAPRRKPTEEDSASAEQLLELMSKSLVVSRIYFQNHFGDPEAQSYAQQRGITKAAARKFEIGYSPEVWRGLVDHFTVTRVRNAAVDAGLLTTAKESKRLYDVFRGRLMFPIRDHAGELVGYGGRLIQKDDDQPKYLNTRETALFSKSAVLYGYFQNSKRIEELKEAIIVEGYIDVTTLSTNGYDYAVAPMGTALTAGQIEQLLASGVRKLWVCFDGDNAGKQAANRNIDAIMEHYHPALQVMLVRMPEGEDPDSVLQKGGNAAFQKCMDAAITLPEHIHSVCSEGISERPCLEDKALYLVRLEPYIERSGGFLQSRLLSQASLYTGLRIDQINGGKESRKTNEQVSSWHRLVMLAGRWMVHADDPMRIANRISKMTAEKNGLAELIALASQITAGQQPSGVMFDFISGHGHLEDHEFSELHEGWSAWVKQAQLSESVERLAKMPFDEAAKQTIRNMLR
ncbi:DNA primase [Pseudomonas cannabina]|nr:toprim domain-containing protein [Pseudomonas cannabina]